MKWNWSLILVVIEPALDTSVGRNDIYRYRLGLKVVLHCIHPYQDKVFCIRQGFEPVYQMDPRMLSPYFHAKTGNIIPLIFYLDLLSYELQAKPTFYPAIIFCQKPSKRINPTISNQNA